MFECPLCMDHNELAVKILINNKETFVRIWEVNNENNIITVFCLKHRILITPPSWPQYGSI